MGFKLERFGYCCWAFWVVIWDWDLVFMVFVAFEGFWEYAPRFRLFRVWPFIYWYSVGGFSRAMCFAFR